MRWGTKLFFGFIFFYLLTVIFANRGIFFSRFDATYWKDKYEHSQWKLPLSVRTLGDDGLYLYEGYRLTTGGDPTLLNAEVPPLGKYLIGYTVRLLGNGYWFGFITNVAILFVFYGLSKKLFSSNLLAIGLTAILACDPLFTDQYTLTMLDALQSLWLLLFLYLFTKFSTDKKQNILLLIGAGISLGFFGETKFPLLLPVPIGIALLSLVRLKNRVRFICIFLVSIAIGYASPYLHYFLLGHNAFDWLRVQKWVVAFYMHTKLTPTYGSAIINLLIGSFQNIFSRSWTRTPHWSPVWTLLTVSLLLSFRKTLFENKLSKNIFILAIIVLGFYSVIPFWTRYLVLLLPLLYLLFGVSLKNLRSNLVLCIIALCICINTSASLHQFFPTAEGTLSQFTYNWDNEFFADMYEDVDGATKSMWNRDTFRTVGLLTAYEGEIEKTTVSYTFPKFSRFRTRIDVPVSITYITRHLGAFKVHATIPLHKEQNRWKVIWKWDLYLPDMTTNTHLVTTYTEARRGDIIANDKSKLAADFPSFLIWITPKQIAPNEEAQLLQMLEDIFGHTIKAVSFHQRLYGNALSDKPVPMGVASKILTPAELAQLSHYRGVTLTPHLGRHAVISDFIKIGAIINTQYFECCSYLYTSTNYEGIDGVEKDKNAQLKGSNGGTLKLVNDKGDVIRTFIQREKRDGVNVQP